MSTPAPAVALRPAGPADAEFLYRVFASTRAEELAPLGWPPEQVEAFLRMQFRAQDTDYHANCPDAAFDVILCGGEPAGRLYVDHRPGEVRIVDIALLPAFRRAGVGTFLLTQLLAEAAAAGRSVTIHVEAFNPARRLYERLGFIQTGSTGIYHLMEWKSGGA
ncbi:MAG TPA: N-acetyltransferase [Urbifossiella sp.]|jgi:ribosomal protein S18 acetylase RimI-like enzyme|nr:N-acetyltransferase [Urbifossiella sp.]